jgi:hypothetical protein
MFCCKITEGEQCGVKMGNYAAINNVPMNFAWPAGSRLATRLTVPVLTMFDCLYPSYMRHAGHSEPRSSSPGTFDVSHCDVLLHDVL